MGKGGKMKIAGQASLFIPQVRAKGRGQLGEGRAPMRGLCGRHCPPGADSLSQDALGEMLSSEILRAISKEQVDARENRKED